jgi:hypothetical protein
MVRLNLSRFDAELHLSVAQQREIGYLGRNYLSSYLGVAPGLIDDEPEPVLRHGSIRVEENPQRIVGGVGVLSLHLAPFRQYANRFLSIFPNEPIGTNGRLDDLFDFIRPLFNLSCMGAESEVGEIEKLVSPGEDLKAQRLHLRVRRRRNDNDVHDPLFERRDPGRVGP